MAADETKAAFLTRRALGRAALAALSLPAARTIITPALAAAPEGSAPAGRMILLTSYPQEVIGRYLDAFTRACPGVHPDVVWQTGQDAVAYLRKGEQPVDVFWSPTLHHFLDLAKAGLFREMEIDRAGLPGTLQGQAISDPGHRFEATEVAGYGLLVNPAVLSGAGLPVPGGWDDLAQPRYAGQVVMPVPSRIGFAPAITEIILQARGWDQGWALLARIADRARLLGGHANMAPSPVEAPGPDGAPPAGIMMTIDFLGSQAILRDQALRFVYPAENAFEPACIAIPAAARNPEAGLAFARFVLSAEGQSLLLDADLRRLPVRPAVYTPQDGGSRFAVNPFTLNAGGKPFDAALFGHRRLLDNALFDHWLAAPHQRRQALTKRLDALTARTGLTQPAAAAVAEADAALTVPPLSEAQAGGLGRTLPPETLTAWDAAAAASLDRAAAALDRAERPAGTP